MPFAWPKEPRDAGLSPRCGRGRTRREPVTRVVDSSFCSPVEYGSPVSTGPKPHLLAFVPAVARWPVGKRTRPAPHGRLLGDLHARERKRRRDDERVPLGLDADARFPQVTHVEERDQSCFDAIGSVKSGPMP